MISPPTPPPVRFATLANGLTVCVLENRRAPVVTTALFYRAGGRDEAPGEGGTAHFLEHMMFKGSAHYGPGEIDRRTQALGGSNNAFTSHDATAYYFDFAPDRWQEALAIEADRMAALTLDELELGRERQVILEEISLYDTDPWDTLERAVTAEFYGSSHPYGLPVLGSREELEAADAARLRAFHQELYRPANAVLVLAGDLGDEAVAAADAAFGDVPAGAPRTPLPAPPPRAAAGQVERRHGELSRLLMALPAPAVSDPDHPCLRLLVGMLSSGRSSRLERLLVDDLQLCSWISVDLGETLDPGHVAIAAELIPGADRARVEGLIRAELHRLGSEPAAPAELERARRIVLADWVFAHQRVHDQALMVGASVALFDFEHPYRQIARLLSASAEELAAAARRWLGGERAVVGWSLPAAGGRTGSSADAAEGSAA
jgi:zinc protease